MAAGTALLCCTLLFVLVFVSADHKFITAKSGQNVPLTCRAPNSNITVVKWSRADLESQNVLFYWTRDFVPVNQHPSFKNRVDLQDKQMKDGDVSLILKDVTIHDEGRYECGVLMEEAISWELTIIYLSVDPPDHKFITAESGQDVTLTCRAPINKIKVVKWSRADLEDEYVLLYMNQHFFPEYQHPSFKNRVDLQDRQMKDGDMSLILKDVTINDEGAYVCRVSVEEKHSWKLSIIYLRVVPPDPKILTAESGQDVSLPCRAPNSNIRVVQWNKAYLKSGNVLSYRNGQFVPIFQHPSFKNRVDLQDRQMKDGDVSLILKDVTINDTGAYMCGVSMAEKHSWEPINIVYLIVVDPPDPKILKTESGQNVTLPCRAPNSKITAVNWTKADLKSGNVLSYQNGQFVPIFQHPSFKNRVYLRDRQMKDGDVSLILKDVTINDTGAYVCGVSVAEKDSWEPINIVYLSVTDQSGRYPVWMIVFLGILLLLPLIIILWI
ncbi:polymeric immunoglobulin receptor-like isoform X1 [Maylandia zebra]|uniref:polymeric immunoglobulin receptor-like isoform X1 n=1 Tax=Maylandia zebra TaxID=106582 RepID=UPI00403C2614